MSQTTKSLKTKRNIFHLLSWLLAFLPILIWLCIAVAKSNDVTKTALAISVTIAGILAIMCFTNLVKPDTAKTQKLPTEAEKVSFFKGWVQRKMFEI